MNEEEKDVSKGLSVSSIDFDEFIKNELEAKPK